MGIPGRRTYCPIDQDLVARKSERERWEQALSAKTEATGLKQAPTKGKVQNQAIIEDRACLHDSNEDWHKQTHCFCVAIIPGSFFPISFRKIFYDTDYSSSGVMYLPSSLDWQYSWTQNIGYSARASNPVIRSHARGRTDALLCAPRGTPLEATELSRS